MLAGLPYHIIKAANRCDAPRPRSQWHRVSSRQECVHSYLRFCPPRKRAPTVSGKIDEFSSLHRGRSKTATSRLSRSSSVASSSVLTSLASTTPISVPSNHRMSVHRFISTNILRSGRSVSTDLGRASIEKFHDGAPNAAPSFSRFRGCVNFTIRPNSVTVRETEGDRLTETSAVEAIGGSRRPAAVNALIFGRNIGLLWKGVGTGNLSFPLHSDYHRSRLLERWLNLDRSTNRAVRLFQSRS